LAAEPAARAGTTAAVADGIAAARANARTTGTHETAIAAIVMTNRRKRERTRLMP
jgi:hypothetical protein